MSRRFLWAGLLLAVLLACGVSFYASSAPDGLNAVAAATGMAGTEQTSATAGSPVAAYRVAGVSDERAGTALAGAVGVVATGLLALTVFAVLRKRQP